MEIYESKNYKNKFLFAFLIFLSINLAKYLNITQVFSKNQLCLWGLLRYFKAFCEYLNN